MTGTALAAARSTSVVVTGVGGPAGRSLAYQLLGLGNHVIGLDMDPGATARLGRAIPFHQVPRCDHADYIPIVLGIADRYGAELIIPTVSEELVLMAEAADPRIAVATPSAVRTAADKWLTYVALQVAGVPAPRSTIDPVLDEFDMVGLGMPFLTKPRLGRGGRGVQVHDRYDGNEFRLPAGEIAQEFAPGQEYGPNVYVADDPADDVVVVLEKEGLAHGRHGNATGVRVVDAPDVAACALAAARALGLRGPVDVDVRRRANGTPVVLEINARFGANSAYAPALLARVLAEQGAFAPEAVA